MKTVRVVAAVIKAVNKDGEPIIFATQSSVVFICPPHSNIHLMHPETVCACSCLPVWYLH